MWQKITHRELLVGGREVRINNISYTIAHVGDYWIVLVRENETWTLSVSLLMEREGFEINLK